MPKISIVLPTYNGEKYITESINSIINQTFTNWELIIVDDCSTDHTPQIIEEYAKNDKRITIVRNEVNRKLPCSLNIGFERAKGDYLTWTSDDNLYLPEALENMVNHLETNKEIYMVRANMDFIDESSNITGAFHSFSVNTLYLQNNVGACFLYRREVLHNVGTYDEELFGVEDYDYWLRIYEQYGDIGQIDKTLYLYRLHDQSLSVQKQNLVNEQRSKLRLKHLYYLAKALEGQNDNIINIYFQFLYSGLSKEGIPEDFYVAAPYLRGDSYFNEEKQYVIFGAGDYGDKAYQLLNTHVAYYTDSNIEKVGTEKNGVMVISPEEMAGLYPKYGIIIAVSKEKTWNMIKQLYDLGIYEFTTFQLLESSLSHRTIEKGW